jgi:hypothetical protein
VRVNAENLAVELAVKHEAGLELGSAASLSESANPHKTGKSQCNFSVQFDAAEGEKTAAVAIQATLPGRNPRFDVMARAETISCSNFYGAFRSHDRTCKRGVLQ